MPFDDREAQKFLEEHGLIAPDEAADQAYAGDAGAVPVDRRLIGAKYYDESKLNGWETWYASTRASSSP
ncbi:MAG: hypothetical protein IPL73_18770 [Candidatus Obscuribacter sp.]|nr:hypothetical protein [Candidatus Obscuribacter sp.]